MEPTLLSAVQSAADTVVALESRDTISRVTDIAILVAAVAVTLLCAYVVWGVAQFRRILRELRQAIHQNLGPASDRARSISENVQFITQAVRTDVERLNASVKALTARLHQASDRMEERIEEFNALMEVVQGEAEDIFLDTAATVRGVREGARSLGKPGAGPPAEGDELPEADGSPPLQDEAALPGER
ncbi:MAG TPA: hypothetical protein VJ997_07990 [Longimicrobiales bacterium]|nr:hypothetical protein [Longimicrobiales bacterium]